MEKDPHGTNRRWHLELHRKPGSSLIGKAYLWLYSSWLYAGRSQACAPTSLNRQFIHVIPCSQEPFLCLLCVLNVVACVSACGGQMTILSSLRQALFFLTSCTRLPGPLASQDSLCVSHLTVWALGSQMHATCAALCGFWISKPPAHSFSSAISISYVILIVLTEWTL